MYSDKKFFIIISSRTRGQTGVSSSVLHLHMFVNVWRLAKVGSRIGHNILQLQFSQGGCVPGSTSQSINHSPDIWVRSTVGSLFKNCDPLTSPTYFTLRIIGEAYPSYLSRSNSEHLSVSQEPHAVCKRQRPPILQPGKSGYRYAFSLTHQL